MPKTMLVVALILAVAMAVPAFAGDCVDMPTGNMVSAKHIELNYIYWDLDGPPGPENASIIEGFVGVTDWLELDGIYADVQGDDTYFKLNAYAKLMPETAELPSLIVGATNVTREDWVGGDDRVSPFILGAYNIHVPEGAPRLNDPLVRVHAAWGAAYHDGVFGGFQAKVHPNLGFAIYNYQQEPSYMVTGNGDNFELTVGYKNGSAFYRGGLFLNW